MCGLLFGVLAVAVPAIYYRTTSASHVALESYEEVRAAISNPSASPEKVRQVALDFIEANRVGWRALDAAVTLLATISAVAGAAFFHVFRRLRMFTPGDRK
jgi:hypothetical protein